PSAIVEIRVAGADPHLLREPEEIDLAHREISREDILGLRIADAEAERPRIAGADHQHRIRDLLLFLPLPGNHLETDIGEDRQPPEVQLQLIKIDLAERIAVGEEQLPADHPLARSCMELLHQPADERYP